MRQEVEHLEVFTGFGTRNRYSVRTPSGEQLPYAFEESGLLGRNFLSSHRPLTVHVVDRNNDEVITDSRSFFWFLSHLHISDGTGQRIGSMQRRFSFLTRKFDLITGRVVAEMRGPIFRPFTFMVYQQGQEIGRVTKQWSGLGREAFTDADTFKVEVDTSRADQDFSLLMLASAISIELDYFEK